MGRAFLPWQLEASPALRREHAKAVRAQRSARKTRALPSIAALPPATKRARTPTPPDVELPPLRNPRLARNDGMTRTLSGDALSTLQRSISESEEQMPGRGEVFTPM